MVDLDTFMRQQCPAAGSNQSRYWCKLAGECTCADAADRTLDTYERQQAWRWTRAPRELLPPLTYGWQNMARYLADP